MDKSSLPLKGIAREKAISELGNDIANAPLLLDLATTEKGKNKKAAQKALAQLDYPEAQSYWKKLLKKPASCEAILNYSTADSISDEVADALLAYLSELGKRETGSVIGIVEYDDKLLPLLGMMLGKASDKILDIYRFSTQLSEKLSTFKTDPNYEYTNTVKPNLGGTIEFIPLHKVFPVILSGSILRNNDSRLTAFAQQMYKEYGDEWIGPVLTSALLNELAKEVFEEFSPYLIDEQKRIHILNVLGTIKFDHKKNKYKFLFYWGDYARTGDSFIMDPLLYEGLDIRWIETLANMPDEKKTGGYIKSTYYVGIIPWAFDDVLGDLIPLNNKECCVSLMPYFIRREKADIGIGQTYLGIMYRIGYKDVEDVLWKKFQCKDNATSIYNVANDLMYLTHWDTEKRLTFFDEVKKKVHNKEINISYWNEQNEQSSRQKIADYKN